MIVSRLALAGGTGLVARRGDGLLHVASPAPDASWHEVVDRFGDAADATAAGTLLIDRAEDGGGDPFVFVAWEPELRVVAFGAVEVGSDLPSMPSLTGASSSTWVEHHPPKVPTPCAVWVGAADWDGTDLLAGVAPASGFRLQLHAGVGAAVRQQLGGGSQRRTLQARRCRRDHLNPVTALVCRVCRESLDALAAIETVDQPELGTVLVSGGKAHAIDRPIVLGRRPDPLVAGVDGEVELCTVVGRKDVSRTHALVRPNGWMIEAVDLGSDSGTLLASPASAEPIVLEPWVPCEVAVGDTLFLGGATQVQIGP